MVERVQARLADSDVEVLDVELARLGPEDEPDELQRSARGGGGGRRPPRRRPTSRSGSESGDRPLRTPLRPCRRLRADRRPRVPVVDGGRRPRRGGRGRRRRRSAQRRDPRRHLALPPLGLVAGRSWRRCRRSGSGSSSSVTPRSPFRRPSTRSSTTPAAARSLARLRPAAARRADRNVAGGALLRWRCRTTCCARSWARRSSPGSSWQRPANCSLTVGWRRLAMRRDGFATISTQDTMEPRTARTGSRALPAGADRRRHRQVLGAGVPHDRRTAARARRELRPASPRSDVRRSAWSTFLVELAEDGYRGVNITVPFKATAWRASRPSRILDVVSMGVANTLLLGPDGPTARLQHRLLGVQVGVSPALRRRSSPVSLRCSVPAASAPRRRPRSSISERRRSASSTSSPSTPTPWPSRSANATRVSRSLWRRQPCRQSHGADGVVNGTPVGMYFQPGTPIDPAAIGEQRWIFDAIYSPVETALMQPCRRGRSATDQRTRSVPRPGDRRLRGVHRPSPQPRRCRRPGGAHRGRGAPANPVTAGDAVSVRQSTNEPGAAQNG